MYHLETKAACCHTHFSQFSGSHQTLGGEEGRYFCRFYLAVYNAVLIARTTINKYIVIQILSFDLKQIYRNECILIPPNSVATAAMQCTDRYSKEGGQNKEDD
jgi:hypothetical protein